MEESLYIWLLAHERLEGDEGSLISTALIIYSTMRAINYLRHIGATDRETALQQFMNQTINQGVRGHAKSASFVNSVWNRDIKSDGIDFG